MKSRYTFTMSIENPDFLKQKYDLQNSAEVEAAAKRKKKQAGKPVGEKPRERIQNYLDRFKEIVDRKDPKERDRGMEALKQILHEKFVIRPEEVPEAVFLLEQRIAREQGHGDIEITDEYRKQKTQQIINNQTQSLDKWIDYLASSEAQYPDWAKYWAFRSMLEMGKLEKGTDNEGKEIARFKKRTKDTAASFPPVNPRALAMTIGVLRGRLEEKIKPKKERQSVENESIRLNDKEFQDLLSTENFSKIYTQFLIEMPEYSTEGLQEIRGEWIKYEQDSNAAPLVKSIEGYPLEWCTVDLATAQGQLNGGDFYVYYSINEAGDAVIPRLAMRMKYDQIDEISGIAPGQNLDPYILPALEEKLKEFGPEADVYRKKVADMKLLTTIENKVKKGEELTKVELIFLYEVNTPIQGFSGEDPRVEELKEQRDFTADYRILFERNTALEQKIQSGADLTREELLYLYEINGPAEGFPKGKEDPRIGELRHKRNHQQDMAIVFECSPEEVTDIGKVRDDTKVVTWDIRYGGPANRVFDKIVEYGGYGEKAWRAGVLKPGIAPMMRFASEMVNRLWEKQKVGESFTKEDLKFIYFYEQFELTGIPITIILKKSLKGRNPKADMLTVFEYEPSEIAFSIDEISETTKVFVGRLGPGIFNKIPETAEIFSTNFSHFPHSEFKRINRESVAFGGKFGHAIVEELRDGSVDVEESAVEFIESDKFKTSEESVVAGVVELSKYDLCEPNEEIDFAGIRRRAQELGLELCSGELGLHYLLEGKGNKEFLIGMEPIKEKTGSQIVGQEEKEFALAARYPYHDGWSTSAPGSIIQSGNEKKDMRGYDSKRNRLMVDYISDLRIGHQGYYHFLFKLPSKKG